MSRNIATIYYRPPEIFFGETKYSYKVDMWAIGCIMAEMIIGTPIFKGRNEIDVIFKMQSIMGSPSEETWPGCSELPNFVAFGEGDSSDLKKLGEILEERKEVLGLSQSCIDLVRSLLVMDPEKRLMAEDALKHEYFMGSDSGNGFGIVKEFLG